MKTAIALVLTGLCLASPAGAETVLDLSNTASVSVQPDEIDATVRAEAEARTAAAAQQEVNRAVAHALEAARPIAGMQAQTAQYSVWRMPPAREGGPEGPWRASQSIELRSKDGAAMLALVGKLQQQGLAVERLEWRLSDDTARTAHETALRKAIAGLRTRAEAVAALLGLRFQSFRTVRLTEPAPPPFPVPMRAMMEKAATVPPSAESGPVAVSATVTAEAVLAGSDGPGH